MCSNKLNKSLRLISGKLARMVTIFHITVVKSVWSIIFNNVCSPHAGALVNTSFYKAWAAQSWTAVLQPLAHSPFPLISTACSTLPHSKHSDHNHQQHGSDFFQGPLDALCSCNSGTFEKQLYSISVLQLYFSDGHWLIRPEKCHSSSGSRTIDQIVSQLTKSLYHVPVLDFWSFPARKYRHLLLE